MGVMDDGPPGADPFANARQALATGAGGGASGEARHESGAFVCSVPEDAPAPRSSHNALGKPVACWAYRDANEQVIHYVCRFEPAGEPKQILPQTLWREGGRLKWAWKAAPAPRPLYGLDGLAKRPAAPVLLVEGEKAADAGAGLFPDFVVMTWSGGSKAPAKADWAPLAGRRVRARAMGRAAMCNCRRRSRCWARRAMPMAAIGRW